MRNHDTWFSPPYMMGRTQNCLCRPLCRFKVNERPWYLAVPSWREGHRIACADPYASLSSSAQGTCLCQSGLLRRNKLQTLDIKFSPRPKGMKFRAGLGSPPTPQSPYSTWRLWVILSQATQGPPPHNHHHPTHLQRIWVADTGQKGRKMNLVICLWGQRHGMAS